MTDRVLAAEKILVSLPLLRLLKEPQQKREVSKTSGLAKNVEVMPIFLEGVEVRDLSIGSPPSWVLRGAELGVELRPVRYGIGPEPLVDVVQLFHVGSCSDLSSADRWVMIRTGNLALKRVTRST